MQDAVLIRPVITEKFTRQAERPGKKQYAFEINREANKIQVKQAVEAAYGVQVADVRTLWQRAERTVRYSRTRVTRGKTARVKRAVVTLVAGQEIDFFANV